MKNIMNLKTSYQLKRQIFIIFLIFFIPRLIYIFLFENFTTDSYNYLRVVDNISKGCGFAFTNSFGECETYIGSAFPGYHIFIYFLKSIGFSNKFIPIFVSLLTTFSFVNLLNVLYRAGLKGKKFYILSLLISLSPLSIGYSRFINMDPILYIFTILIITELIKLKKNPIFFKSISLRILAYLILDIYIKPTSIILVIPYLFITIVHFGMQKFIKFSILFLLIITISILPWGLRDIKLGADRPFKSCGNQLGNNVCSLNNWVTSFVLTEYEYASIMYPIYDRETGNRKNAKISTKYNPFISKSDLDLKEVNKILQKENPEYEKGFTDDEQEIINNFAKTRFKKNGLIGNIFLFTFKYLSLLLNPLTSWGLPISVGVNSKLSFLDISLIAKLFLKGLFFVYRAVIFWFYFKDVFLFLRELNLIKIFSKKNLNLIRENSIFVAGFLTFLANFVLYVNIFGTMQHRYFYAFIPFIEIMVFLRLIYPKRSILN